MLIALVSYERAREKLSRAEETSDINTDCERKRKRHVEVVVKLPL